MTLLMTFLSMPLVVLFAVTGMTCQQHREIIETVNGSEILSQSERNDILDSLLSGLPDECKIEEE